MFTDPTVTTIKAVWTQNTAPESQVLFSTIILFSYIQFSGLLALTLVSNAIPQPHRIKQSRWTLAIQLHSTVITRTPLRPTLSHLWAVESLNIPCSHAVTPWDGSLVIRCTISLSPWRDSPWGDCWSCWMLLVRRSVFLEHSRQHWNVLSFSNTRTFWWSVPVTRRHRHSGRSDVRGIVVCLTAKRCCFLLQYPLIPLLPTS